MSAASSLRELRLRAARLDMPDIEALGGRTPGELAALFELYEARRLEQRRLMDELAFLIGGYVALALHDPAHYPDAPCGYAKAEAASGDAALKRAFRRLAGKRPPMVRKGGRMYDGRS